MRRLPTLLILLAGAQVGWASELSAVRRLLKDPSPSSRAAAVRRLTGDGSRAALDAVVETLGDAHPYVRRAAAAVLGQALDARARRRARTRIAKARDSRLRAAACTAYAHWLDVEGRAGLRTALKDREPGVRIAALRALGAWHRDARDARGDVVAPAPTHRDLVAVAVALLDDRVGIVRAHATDALRSLGPSALPKARWIALLGDDDARVRLAALEGSVALGGEAAVVAVLHGLNDAVWSVRLTAAELARAVRTRRVLEALPPRLTDSRRVVRDAVHDALVALTGIPFDPDAGRWQRWLAGDGQDFDPATRKPNAARALPSGTDTVVKVLGLPIASDHVAFVLDASGSMARATAGGRSRWEAVCDELNGALAGLRAKQTRVAVHCFATTVRTLPAAPLTKATHKRIAAFLEAQDPRGRTALFDGIAAGLADDTIDTLVVLSDGAPSAGTWFTKTDLLRGVQEANRFRRARIHVLAVGVDGIAKRWRDVLKRVAEEHRGTYLAR